MILFSKAIKFCLVSVLLDVVFVAGVFVLYNKFNKKIMKNFSFSVKPSEHAIIQMIAKINHHCMRNGLRFSYIVIEALKAYKIEGLENAD